MQAEKIIDQFLALQKDPKTNQENQEEFISKADALRDTLVRMYQEIGVEDKMHCRNPELKTNRLAILEASTSAAAIEQSYELYEALSVMPESVMDSRRRILDLLGFLNNYDPYINVRGLLTRKDSLLEKYAEGPASEKKDRFALVVAQSLDILSYQKNQEYEKHDERTQGYAKEGYEQAHMALADFLQKSGSSSAFAKMGFSMGTGIDEYSKPEGHPAVARVTSLSEQNGEIAFITMHQIFETFFDEALLILRRMSQGKNDISADELNDVSFIIGTVNKFYEVTRNLVPRDSFHAMRDSFGIASGAQSQQYHLIENHIGYPGDSDRHKTLSFLLGNRFIHEIEEEAPKENSLKERLRDTKDPAIQAAKRELNLSMLDFKSVHGNVMLKYLFPQIVGSGGTAITHFFADGMGPIFEDVFSPEETRQLSQAIQQGRHIPGIQKTDGFLAVSAFTQQARVNEAPNVSAKPQPLDQHRETAAS